MSIGWLTSLHPHRERFRVYLNGEPMTFCIEAQAGEPGFVVMHVIGLDGKPVLDTDGRAKTDKRVGRVEIREIPLSEIVPMGLWRP